MLEVAEHLTAGTLKTLTSEAFAAFQKSPLFEAGIDEYIMQNPLEINNLVQKMYAAIQAHKINPSKGILMEQLHNTERNHRTSFKNRSAFSRFYSHLCKSIIDHLSDKSDAEIIPINLDNETLHMETEQGLGYVAGYLLRTMKDSFHAPEIEEFLACIQRKKGEVDCEAESMECNYLTWVVAVDRGGLFYITEEFYKFLVLLEQLCSGRLKQKVSNCFLKDLLVKTLSDERVQLAWDDLTSIHPNICLEESQSKKLLSFLLQKFSGVRAQAYVDQIKRQEDARINKPADGLRAQLAKLHLDEQH